MAQIRTEQNPRLGDYRVELRDAKGRFTKRYSSARLFRIYFDGKPVSDTIRFKPRSSARDKRARVVAETNRATRRRTAKEKKKKKVAPKKRRPKRKPAAPKKRPEREELVEVEEVPRKPPSRSIQVVDDEEFGRRIHELQYIADEIADDPVIGSKLVRYMDASSKGVETHPIKTWDKEKKKYVYKRGSTFKRLELNGMKKRNMIWWIAKEYLRRLGHKFFDEVAFAYSKSIIRFRVYIVTNMTNHRSVIAAPRDAADIVFRRGLKGKARKEQHDIMVWQMVQAIMKSLYADGHYPSGSLTSSDAFFQVKLPSSKSIGRKLTRTQDFRLGFTIILQRD